MSEMDNFREILDDNPVVFESIFKSQYLQAFVEKDPTVGVKWVDRVSGTPYISVNVVSDENPSEILFTVPPIKRRPRLSREDSERLNEKLDHIRVSTSRNKQLGAMTSKKELSNVKIETGYERADGEAWLKILARYGYDVSVPKLTNENPLHVDFSGW